MIVIVFFFEIVIVFGDYGFEFILMYVFRAFLSRLSCGGTVFFCKTIDIDFAAPVW